MNDSPTPQSDSQTSVEASVIAGAPIKPGDKDERLGGAQSMQPIFAAPVSPVSQFVAPQLRTEQTPNWQANADVIANELSEKIPTATPPLLQKKEVPRYADGKRPDSTDLDKGEKLLAAIGYIGILALVPLLLRRGSAYCQHHGSQGLVLGAMLMVVELVSRIIGGALFGFEVFVGVLIFATWVGGFILAFSGSWFRIPVVYDWAQDLNIFAEEMDKENRLKNQD